MPNTLNPKGPTSERPIGSTYRLIANCHPFCFRGTSVWRQFTDSHSIIKSWMPTERLVSDPTIFYLLRIWYRIKNNDIWVQNIEQQLRWQSVRASTSGKLCLPMCPSATNQWNSFALIMTSHRLRWIFWRTFNAFDSFQVKHTLRERRRQRTQLLVNELSAKLFDN